MSRRSRAKGRRSTPERMPDEVPGAPRRRLVVAGLALVVLVLLVAGVWEDALRQAVKQAALVPSCLVACLTSRSGRHN